MRRSQIFTPVPNSTIDCPGAPGASPPGTIIRFRPKPGARHMRYSATVAFEFPEGFLETADANGFRKAVNAVLLPQTEVQAAKTEDCCTRPDGRACEDSHRPSGQGTEPWSESHLHLQGHESHFYGRQGVRRTVTAQRKNVTTEIGVAAPEEDRGSGEVLKAVGR